MTIAIESADLIPALKTALSIIPKRVFIPILGHVRLTVASGMATLESTDLDTALSIRFPASGDCDVTIEARALLAAILPKTLVTIRDIDDSGATVESGGMTARIATLPIADWPTMRAYEPEATLTLPAPLFADRLGQVAYAQSTEETRYYRRGVYLHHVDDSLALVATDGHRLALYRGDIAYSGPDVIIPTLAVKTLLGILKKPAGQITLAIHPLRVVASYGNITLRSKTIDGTFPDYTRILPKDAPKHRIPFKVFPVKPGKETIARFERDAVTLTDDDQSRVIPWASIEGDSVYGFTARYIADAVAAHGECIAEAAEPFAPWTIRTKTPDVIALLMSYRV